MSVALAAQLREGTKKSHTMAENTGFVSCFLKGVVDKASYRKLVADLYFVYSAMEDEISQLNDHPVVGPVAMAQLNRREALEQDLTYYFGDSWKEEIQTLSLSSGLCGAHSRCGPGVSRAVGGPPLHPLPR